MEDDLEIQIDHYRIINQLGASAFSTVYKAYDTRLQSEVTLKLIHKESFPQDLHKRLLKLIENEVNIQVEINHRHIVPIYDYGDKEGSPYLVMDYYPRGSLIAYIGQTYPHQEVVSLLIPILDALSYAHKRRMIHQNIKPRNILIDEEGQLHLSDFGIAKLFRLIEESLTGSSIGLGTPEYMAPEQWQGQVSEASDQYAIGVVFYELLTGQKPYIAETPQAVRMNQLLRPVVSISSLNTEVPAELDRIILKSLAHEPDQRYKDATSFIKALEQYGSIESTDHKESAPIDPHQIKEQEINPVSEIGQETGSENGLTPILTQNTKSSTQTQADSTETIFGFGKKTLSGCAMVLGMIIVSMMLLVLLLNVFDIGNRTPLAGIYDSFRTALIVEDSGTTENLGQIATTTTTLVGLPSNTAEYTKTPTNTFTYTPTFTVTEIVLSAQVIVDNALLRSGPDFSHPIISERLKPNSIILVTSKSPSEFWFYVNTEDGLEGWLIKDWIELDVPDDLIPIEQFIPTSPIIFTATSEPIPTPIPPQENTPAPTRPPQENTPVPTRPPQYP